MVSGPWSVVRIERAACFCIEHRGRGAKEQMFGRKAFGFFLLLVFICYFVIGLFALSMIPFALTRPPTPIDDLRRLWAQVDGLQAATMIGCPALALAIFGLIKLFRLERYNVKNCRPIPIRRVRGQLLSALVMGVMLTAVVCRWTTPHVKYFNGTWRAGGKFSSRVVAPAELPELFWRDMLASAVMIVFVSMMACVLAGALWWHWREVERGIDLVGESDDAVSSEE